jgi:hypothetical protein
MTRLAMSDLGDNFARIFGAREEPEGPGRSRKCKTCGGWHLLSKPWPHNCRQPAPPRNPDLHTPQIAPPFDAFMTGQTETAAYIGDRRAKRDYMDRHDLVEYDEGVAPDPEPTDRQLREEFARDLNRVLEMDPLAIKPVDVVGRTDTDGAGDIDVSSIEVAK